jgi:putative ABC transport system permease protein
MNVVEIKPLQLAVGYLLLAFPLAIIVWYRIGMLSQTLIAVARMTLQLIFVGLYLEIIFQLNNGWLTLGWLIVMILVADLSIVRGCNLRLRRFAPSLFAALCVGISIPLLLFVGVILRRSSLLDAQYAIPIGGMILGNCLRAILIGMKTFYWSIRDREKAFLYVLSQGASLPEATRPYLRDAFRTALAPTLATMATIGLVSLPGMMTGVILGGSNPVTAIKYQIAIMISIFSGTAIALVLGIKLSMHRGFAPSGTLDKQDFRR